MFSAQNTWDARNSLWNMGTASPAVPGKFSALNKQSLGEDVQDPSLLSMISMAAAGAAVSPPPIPYFSLSLRDLRPQ